MNWREFALAFASTTLMSKSRRLLELLRQWTSFFGQLVSVSSEEDWPLIYAASSIELSAILKALQEQRLVTDGSNLIALTMKGWTEIEPLVGGTPGLGFLAMSFDSSMNPAFDAMREAVEKECKLQLTRVDAEHFEGKICDRIVADIRRSQFVIADFTLHRGGVYFEAGFALALGKIVIWSCQEDDLPNVHFDTRQYPHIVWSDPADLKSKLTSRVRALVPGAQ